MDLENLYKEYFVVVYKYILSISRDQNTAEEIVQETFFKAMKKIDDFRGDCSVKSWLCQIAKNTYYDYLRQQSKYVELGEVSEEKLNVEPDYIWNVDSKQAHKILHNMKEPYKEVFSLRVFGELSFSDIGELFEKSDSWARVTFHRARLMIKEEMENGEN
jgi:RNA polymerase sigma-70 factor (ECF subfamily)